MKKSAITDLTSSTLELLVDSQLDSGLVKDIPIFGTVVKIAELSKSVRDYFFLKKLGVFIKSLEELNDKEKEKIKEFSKGKDSEEIAEKLILVIEKISDSEKSKLIAHIFKEFCNEGFNKDYLLRSLDVIENTFLGDINKFLDTGYIQYHTAEAMESIGLSGLISTPLIMVENFKESELLKFQRQEDIGKTFYRDSNFGKFFRRTLNGG